MPELYKKHVDPDTRMYSGVSNRDRIEKKTTGAVVDTTCLNARDARRRLRHANRRRWTNFTLEEQDKILAVPPTRTSRLLSW